MLIFFFQAEDGIRDYKVTGVQTCALPIFRVAHGETGDALAPAMLRSIDVFADPLDVTAFRQSNQDADIRNQIFDGQVRSEERRVGKECRQEWSRLLL